MNNREQFEVWYLDAWGCTEDNLDSLFEESPHGNEYYRFGVRLAWQAWQQATKQYEAKCAALAAELEAAEKRSAELSRHLQCAHDFIENTEAFGYEASSGILCCGDAQWNIDDSKEMLVAAGIIAKAGE